MSETIVLNWKNNITNFRAGNAVLFQASELKEQFKGI